MARFRESWARVLVLVLALSFTVTGSVAAQSGHADGPEGPVYFTMCENESYMEFVQDGAYYCVPIILLEDACPEGWTQTVDMQDREVCADYASTYLGYQGPLGTMPQPGEATVIVDETGTPEPTEEVRVDQAADNGVDVSTEEAPVAALPVDGVDVPADSTETSQADQSTDAHVDMLTEAALIAEGVVPAEVTVASLPNTGTGHPAAAVNDLRIEPIGLAFFATLCLCGAFAVYRRQTHT